MSMHREFWIMFHDNNSQLNFVSNKPYKSESLQVSKHVQVHVIEYSALVEAQEKIKSLEEKCEEYLNRWCDRVLFIDKINLEKIALAKKLHRTEQALEVAKKQFDEFCDGKYRDYNVDGQSNETLMEIEKNLKGEVV